MKKNKNADIAVENYIGIIGGLISKLRLEVGMTQQELAEKIGSTQSAIARIERGEQNISTEMVAKIENALNRNIVQIANG